MLEMRNTDGTIRNFKTKNTYNNKPCPLCGQYFRPNENQCLVVFPFEKRKLHKKLETNYFVHTDEWLDFCKGLTEDEIIDKFISHKTPRRKPWSFGEKMKTEAFRESCIEMGFCAEYKNPYGLTMHKRGSSMYFEYYIATDFLRFDYRGNRGMFDSLYTREILANVRNRMNEKLGIEQRDTYTAKEEMEKIVKETKNMLSNMGLDN